MGVLAYGADVVAGVLATVAVAVLVWCRGAARAESALTDRMVRAGVWLRAAGARVAAHGLEHLRSPGPCVVVCNHQSALDPIVLLRTLQLSLGVLAMRELFRIPLFGPAMRTIGMIEVDRASPDFGQIDRAAACGCDSVKWLHRDGADSNGRRNTRQVRGLRWDGGDRERCRRSKSASSMRG
jgi:Acyltransferase